MPNTYTVPQISVCYEMESDSWQLMATSHMRTTVCGERILRAEPWPSIRWASDTEEEAESEAVKLRLYLAQYAGGKLKDREHAPTKRGWWQD